MAAPPDITIKTLSGRFVLNKVLSDDVNAMLVLQGLSWFTRKAINLATVVLTINEYVQDSIYHIDITSVASGLSTTQEYRTIDWRDQEDTDKIFGNVKAKARWWKNGEFRQLSPGDKELGIFLRGERLKDGITLSKFLDSECIQTWTRNIDKGGGWTAEQTWGFEEIEGKRYYTNRIVVEKGGKVQIGRLIYDYIGKIEKRTYDQGK